MLVAFIAWCMRNSWSPKWVKSPKKTPIMLTTYHSQQNNNSTKISRVGLMHQLNYIVQHYSIKTKCWLRFFLLTMMLNLKLRGRTQFAFNIIFPWMLTPYFTLPWLDLWTQPLESSWNGYIMLSINFFQHSKFLGNILSCCPKLGLDLL